MSDVGALIAGELSPLYRLYFWGIALIRQIQSIESPSLTVVVKAITTLGAVSFYLPVLLFLFWCIDEKWGIRLVFVLLLSAAINVFFKDLLKQPRPFTLDPSVGLVFESSYGIPSGHAQLSLTFWGFLAGWVTHRLRQFVKHSGSLTGAVRVAGGTRVAGVTATFHRRRLLVWSATAVIILLIAFTRLYLGVHFLTDILAGWLLGALVLVLYRILGPRVESLLDRGGTRACTISAAALAMLMNALGINVMLGGVILGLGVGYSLTLRRTPFSAHLTKETPSYSPLETRKPPRHAVLLVRYTVGLLGVGAIALILSSILPGKRSLFATLPLWGAGSPYRNLAEFVLAGALGVWVSFGAPWCFLRLGLASPRSGAPRDDAPCGDAPLVSDTPKVSDTTE